MLNIENLSFSYGDKIIIKDFSLEIPEKGVFAIMGPSGCGKSTLFSLISGLLKPDSGSIKCHAQKIAFAFQDARLMPWMTAAENVNFVLGGKKNTVVKAISALEEVGLGEDADKYPDELSGGMQKRVSLARAFVTDADFFLLDEPFTGLDSERKRNIITKVKEIGKKSSVLLITHDIYDAEECASILFNFNELNKA